LTKKPVTRRVVVLNRDAAQSQFWRHVSNRAALSILANNRHPVLTSHSSAYSPRTPIGSDTFACPVESIDILTLADQRAWPESKTAEPLFRYSADRQEFRRREGLSDDVLALFEALLRPTPPS